MDKESLLTQCYSKSCLLRQRWKSHLSVINQIEKTGRLTEAQILLCLSLHYSPHPPLPSFRPKEHRDNNTRPCGGASHTRRDLFTTNTASQRSIWGQSQHKHSLPMKTRGSPARSKARIQRSEDETLFNLQVIVKNAALSAQRSRRNIPAENTGEALFNIQRRTNEEPHADGNTWGKSGEELWQLHGSQHHSRGFQIINCNQTRGSLRLKTDIFDFLRNWGNSFLFCCYVTKIPNQGELFNTQDENSNRILDEA